MELTAKQRAELVEHLGAAREHYKQRASEMYLAASRSIYDSVQTSDGAKRLAQTFDKKSIAVQSWIARLEASGEE